MGHAVPRAETGHVAIVIGLSSAISYTRGPAMSGAGEPRAHQFSRSRGIRIGIRYAVRVSVIVAIDPRQRGV
jgi:hypothetical protein